MERIRDRWSAPAWIGALVALIVAVALFVAAVHDPVDHGTAVAVGGAASLAVLVFGLVAARVATIWLAVAGLGVIGAVADAPGAPLYAVGLFVVAEAAISSTEERFARVVHGRVGLERLGIVALVAAGSLVLGGLLRMLARGEGGGSAHTVVAAAGIVALLILIVTRVRPATSR